MSGGTRQDVRTVAWWVVVAAAAGGIVGILVGGVGGRLFMLIVRSTSDDVDGAISDDGFEIGRVSIDTLNLLAFGATAGTLFAGLYVLLRTAVPAALRIPVATILATTIGGAAFTRPEGTDLAILEPTWLAVAGPIALCALAGLAISLAVERIGRIAPWSLPRIHLLALTPALVGFPGLILLALGGATVVIARRAPAAARLAPFARPAALGLILFALAVSGLGLIDDLAAVA